MKSEDIHFSDWQRILFGQVPAEFYIELIIRAGIVYLILMIAIRAMGKRMSSQLSRNELAALVSLAAAIGVPMLAANRGLLPAIIVAIVVVTIQRLIASRAVTHPGFERISQGKLSILVKDNVVNIATLSEIGISRSQLFSQLRGQNVTHLGLVERFYMEANGTFTLVKLDEPRSGLSVLPDTDPDFIAEFEKDEQRKVCFNCGEQQESTGPDNCCPNCGQQKWVAAVKNDGGTK
jgi:uncharacterized membrane protein YcaP (DUF421 family)